MLLISKMQLVYDIDPIPYKAEGIALVLILPFQLIYPRQV
jgi:hypothetical protein